MSARENIRTLELDEMTFAFDEGPKIFNGVTFALPKSRAVWIRSPGGRGKSTLLKILAGLLTPQGGRYLVNGEDVNKMSFEQFLAYRLNMGYGFDMFGLLNNKTLFENLTLPLLYHRMLEPSEAFRRVDDLIEMFGMQHVRDMRPFTISGSQRKLSCVLRAFVHWPQVVFLDEPLTGLKHDNLTDLLHYIDEGFENRGLKQIFFSSESPELAKRFGAEELLISVDWLTVRSVA